MKRRALRRRYGRANGRGLWTVDYKAGGVLRIAIVRAMTAADAVAALARVEGRHGDVPSHVHVMEGHDVPGYESRRIIDARSIL